MFPAGGLDFKIVRCHSGGARYGDPDNGYYYKLTHYSATVGRGDFISAFKAHLLRLS